MSGEWRCISRPGREASGYWDRRSQAWLPLDDRYNRDLAQALRSGPESDRAAVAEPAHAGCRGESPSHLIGAASPPLLLVGCFGGACWARPAPVCQSPRPSCNHHKQPGPVAGRGCAPATAAPARTQLTRREQIPAGQAPAGVVGPGQARFRAPAAAEPALVAVTGQNKTDIAVLENNCSQLVQDG